MSNIVIKLLLSEAKDPRWGRDKSGEVQGVESGNIFMVICVLINCSNLKFSYSIKNGDYEIHNIGSVMVLSVDEILEIIAIVVLYAIGNDDRGQRWVST